MARTIMTVDDSDSIRQMVEFSLTQAGHTVLQAADGKEAISKLSGAQVDLVITDLNMPNVDGIELIRWIRNADALRFVPIIMLTTESQDAKKKEGKSAGATGWIVKPFRPEQLLAVVDKVLA